MRVAHFDCFSGISGDMTLGALIDAGVDASAIEQGIASLGLPVRLKIQKVQKGGFAATQAQVEADPEHQHRHLRDVEAIIARGALKPGQRQLALGIFRRLAQAEAAVHGIPIDRVHFHEVGALDSIADIVGAAIGLDLLGVEKFTSRPVPTGTGTVKAAHGLMPIPAPGTAELLKGAPLAPCAIQAELTTPTGAAILMSIVNEWVDQPVMRLERIGYGAGQRDLPEQANVLRLFVGTTESRVGTDQVWVLQTNLDDVSAEVVGYCYDLLFAAGALDVYTQSIQMKKNRPGVLVTVLAPESAAPAVEEVLFRETATLGVRRYPAQRRKLERKAVEVQTRWGAVRGKLSRQEGRPPVFSPEYEDCARVARTQGVPLREVYEEARQAQRTKDEG